jgi:hypothetical protein
MEKLLSKDYKNKTKNAGTLTSQRTKNISLSNGSYENIFCQHTSEKLYKQPISGCFILVNQ